MTKDEIDKIASDRAKLPKLGQKKLVEQPKPQPKPLEGGKK